MRSVGLSLAIAALSASSAMAAAGDQWILGINHIDNQGAFATYTGAGFSGTESSGAAQYVGNSYGFNNNGAAVGVNRVYWELSGNSVNNGTPVPTTTQLYKVEFFGTTEAGHNSWQPVESQFHGIAGEGYPYEPSIPWPGQFGTNHQYIAAGGANDGAWHTLGPGPQADTSSPADGTMMWLTSGSWLYAKWDFGFSIDRSWSALRLTQITPVVGPPPVGDYNKNGYVDAADYVLWRKTYGQHGANLPADGYPDTYIDEYDYDVWREAFGNTGSGAGTGLSSFAAVPEPTTLALTAIVAVACLTACRRRRGLAVGYQRADSKTELRQIITSR
jgi:hypothetical protein